MLGDRHRRIVLLGGLLSEPWAPLDVAEAVTRQAESHAEWQDNGHQLTVDAAFECRDHVGVPLIAALLRTRAVEPFAVPYRVKSDLLLVQWYAEVGATLTEKIAFEKPHSRCSEISRRIFGLCEKKHPHPT